MSAVEQIRASIPEPARDIRINLQSVLQSGVLTVAQKWGVAIATAANAKDQALVDALVTDALAEVSPAVIDDAFAAASLMAMNNVYYRFRATVGKESYASMPARLRMARLAAPATNKLDFELFCLAVSAVNGCATCVAAHEAAVTKGGLSEERVHDAVRVAAVAAAACHAFL